MDVGAVFGNALILTTPQLRARGLSSRRLAAAVAAGEILKLRRSAYAPPNIDPVVAKAIRTGGRVGCVTALSSWGVWVTRADGVHVHQPSHGHRDKASGVVLHWSALVEPGGVAAVSVLDALLAAMVCQTFADAVASVDSALQRGLVTQSGLLPHCTDRRRARVLAASDGRAESGLESLVRVALVRAGLSVQPQAQLAGVGRVDLLVEECVVVETDGAGFHSGPRRHADHLRDAAAAAAGLTPLRFDTNQVLGDLSAVVLAVVGAVRSHRAARFGGAHARRLAIRATSS